MYRVIKRKCFVFSHSFIIIIIVELIFSPFLWNKAIEDLLNEVGPSCNVVKYDFFFHLRRIQTFEVWIIWNMRKIFEFFMIRKIWVRFEMLPKTLKYLRAFRFVPHIYIILSHIFKIFQAKFISSYWVSQARFYNNFIN